MPKFLDAPSWYDSDQNLKTIEGSFTIVVEGGWGSTIEVPYVGGANKQYLPYVSGHRALVAQGSAFGQIPYWQNGSAGFQNIAAGTTKGQVLTWNGSSVAPSWATPSISSSYLYCHNVRMTHSYSATTYYHLLFSFFSTRNTPYTTSSYSTMRSDIYSRYKDSDDECYILAAGSTETIDSVSILQVTSSSFIAKASGPKSDEYTLTGVSSLWDECFAVLSSVSLSV